MSIKGRNFSLQRKSKPARAGAHSLWHSCTPDDATDKQNANDCETSTRCWTRKPMLLFLRMIGNHCEQSRAQCRDTVLLTLACTTKFKSPVAMLDGAGDGEMYAASRETTSVAPTLTQSLESKVGTRRTITTSASLPMSLCKMLAGVCTTAWRPTRTHTTVAGYKENDC